MPLQLPLDAADPNYRVGITLQDTPYNFDVYWNERDQAWFFDLYDVNESPIITSVKMVLGAFLLARCTDPRKPSGAIIMADLSGQGQDATIDDLGSRVVAMYFTVDELENPEDLP
jgi:hypothetical protein